MAPIEDNVFISIDWYYQSKISIEFSVFYVKFHLDQTWKGMFHMSKPQNCIWN
jgi:hypothetical protein